LGNEAHSQVLRQVNDRVYDGSVIRSFVHALNEALINLEAVQRETVQIAERRVAGSKVIHVQVNAKTSDVLKNRDHILRVADHSAFGQFQSKGGRVDSRGAEDF